MFTETYQRLAGVPTDTPTSVRVGFARGDGRPMATVQLNVNNDRTSRTFDDPDELLNLIEELTMAAKFIIDNGPRPKPRAHPGEGRRSRVGVL